MAVSITGNIQVVLGNGWTGGKDLDPSDVIVLSPTGTAGRWSESGSNNPDHTSNRLRITLEADTSQGAEGGFCGTAGPPSYSMVPSTLITFRNALYLIGTESTPESPQFTYAGMKYAKDLICSNTSGDKTYDTPGELWNATIASTRWNTVFDSNFFHNSQISGTVGASSIFSSFTLVEDATYTVADGVTMISDGATTPISFGSVEQGGSGPTKTFTIDNLNTESDLTVSNITVPTGYTITDNVTSPIGASSSDTFTVRLDTSVVGSKTGEIVITTNGSPATFNFAISGTVTEAEASSSSESEQAATTVNGVFGSIIFGG